MTEILVVSDVMAALTYAGMTQIYGGLGSPGMAGIQALVTSIVARLMSRSTMLGSAGDTLSERNKNELIVAVIGAVSGYTRKGSWVKGAVSAASADLIGSEILSSFAWEDKVLFGGGVGSV
jgi:hypothetical protein